MYKEEEVLQKMKIIINNNTTDVINTVSVNINIKINYLKISHYSH